MVNYYTRRAETVKSKKQIRLKASVTVVLVVSVILVALWLIADIYLDSQ